MNIAVFCSGNGSNFQAIVDACKKSLFKANIALMVCDNPDAHAIRRAEKEQIKAFVVRREDFSSKEEFEEKVIEELKREKIELICLAGYMRLLSPRFVERYKNRILNVHPALLPSFKGTHGIKDALDYGVKVTGVTVHFVNKDMDTGPIIIQEAVEIEEADTEKTLAEKIHTIEHRIYPEAIRLYIEQRLKVSGRRVRILATAALAFMIFGFDPGAMLGRDIVSSPYFLDSQKIPFFVRPTEDRFIPTSMNGVGLLAAYDRLGLITYEQDVLEATNEIGLGDSDILNSSIEIERPPTREEIERMRIEGSIKMARTFAEKLDSMEMEFAHKGLSSLIDTAMNVIDFRDYIGERYHLHFRVDSEKALLRYKKRF